MPTSLLLMLAAATSRSAALPGAWATFSRAEAMSHLAVTVEVATDGVDPSTKRLEYKLRRTERSSEGEKVDWANSRLCPAIRPVLASMRDLQSPRLAPPGFANGPVEVIVDGTAYSLSASAAFGGEDARVAMSSNIDTPLAVWVDESLAALERCW